jgi:hypothetical protein
MALDGVPWFIGGDAEHGPDVARMLAYLATGGKQGVVSPADLKVLPLDVPGPGVKVLGGGASILNRAASQQAYTVRNPTTDVDSVKIAATGSGSGRSDLIVCRVDNPNVDGNAPAPANLAKGPYVKFDVIAGVPAGTRQLADLPQYAGLSAIELARVDLPASTGTVTSSMVTDLRALATPRSERVIVKGALTDASVTLSTGAWRVFPQNPIGGIPIPSWATHAVIRAATTIRFVSGDAYANVQAFIGPAGQQDSVTLFTDFIIDSTAGGGSYRQPVEMPSDGLWAVPAALRGTTAQISSRARGKSNGGVIAAPASDYYYADITFMERIS